MKSRSNSQETKNWAFEPVTMTPVRAARRAKVVQAAEAVFIAHGFRGTTMEAIAEASGMSKVTIYGYFRDKDAVFKAVAENLAIRLKQAAEAALLEDIGLIDRVSKCLVAKQAILLDLLRSSVHATDLINSKDPHVRACFSATDQEICRKIAGIIQATGRTRAKSSQTARMLFAAANGMAASAADCEELTADIKAMVTALIPPRW